MDSIDPRTQPEQPQPGGARRGDPETPARWKLSRAGIINVYQYGDETLEFGDGRLLLRGVNGSGKSTAMNMLLPFLLDGDTRRIDAAGEQSGVLRSWMLSGREEPQPQGYLWLELARGDEYTCFGCGIRANRSTERVSTWWFVTSLRPGIDVHLVEGRVPLTADKLRAVLDPGVVYAQDQRASYRAELRARLYGGSDLEQYLHLLRIVRNPRVGDRLDTDLPQYLEDALPLLSDAALEDAAQPLEDLEEHRRNVAELGRTSEALGAMHAVYVNYARAELRRIAEAMREYAREHARRQREEGQAHEAAIAAQRRLEQATAAKERAERVVLRIDQEIRSLEASEAYQSGAQLTDLRNHVQSLERTMQTAEGELGRRRAASRRALEAVGGAKREAHEEQGVLRVRLEDLSASASRCGLTARPAATPVIRATVVEAGSERTFELPADTLDLVTLERSLGAVQAAAQQRGGDVDAVRSAIQAAQRAEHQLRAAERAAAQAEAALADARNERDTSRQAFLASLAEWKRAVEGWLERLSRHCDAYGVEPPGSTDVLEDPATRVALGESLVAPLLHAIDGVIQQHEQRRADRESTLAQHEDAVRELEMRVAELAQRQLPDPPLEPWQLREGRRCLAEWVDFADSLEPGERAGLEAALEASGLLCAEVRSEAGLALADGQLIACEGSVDGGLDPSHALSHVLRVTPPEDAEESDIEETVLRILRRISTRWGDVDSHPVITTLGEFSLGDLRGRHQKDSAEHIGLTARRAALERQRTEAAAALTRALELRGEARLKLEAAKAELEGALQLRVAVPAEHEPQTCFGRREQAERAFERAELKYGERRAEVAVAEQAHAGALESLYRTATGYSLPRELEALDDVRRELEGVRRGCRDAQNEVMRLARALDRWRSSGAELEAARADERSSEEHRASSAKELELAQARWTTLEQTLGVEYAKVLASIEVCRKELVESTRQRESSARAELAASGEVAATRERHHALQVELEAAHDACVRELPLFRSVLDVRGLLDAALSELVTEPDSPSVPQSVSQPAPESVSEQRSMSRSPAVSERIGDGRAASSVGAPDAQQGSEVQHSGSAQGDLRSGASSRAEALPEVGADPAGLRKLCEAVLERVPAPDASLTTSAEGVRQSLRRRRDSLGAGWDAEDHQPDPRLPLRVDVTGPSAPQIPLPEARRAVAEQLRTMSSLLSSKQDQALRNLLQGLVAREVAEKLYAARELVGRMNARLASIRTSHGIGVSLRWRQRDDLDSDLVRTVGLLAKRPELRSVDEDRELTELLGRRIDDARQGDPELPYRELIAGVLDYRGWHRMQILLHRPGRAPERLSRRTALSEGEKKIVSYLPLFAAVAASCDALGARAPDAPRFVLLDDAFAKVSEDNHPKLFGLLVELDLDFIATSERLWGTHSSVPELAITEVIRDAELGAIVLEHSRWVSNAGTHA